MNPDQIKLSTPKFKQGDHVWYVQDKARVFERAYVCSWKLQTYSFGQSNVYYTVEHRDLGDDDDNPLCCAYDVPENRIYANELDARRKQLELWSSEHTQQQHIMEDLDRLRAEIMQRILTLEQEETANGRVATTCKE